MDERLKESESSVTQQLPDTSESLRKWKHKQLINFIYRSPFWEANDRSRGEEIQRLTWNPELNGCYPEAYKSIVHPPTLFLYVPV
jgi:hypothetical protein